MFAEILRVNVLVTLGAWLLIQTHTHTQWWSQKIIRRKNNAYDISLVEKLDDLRILASVFSHIFSLYPNDACIYNRLRSNLLVGPFCALIFPYSHSELYFFLMNIFLNTCSKTADRRMHIMSYAAFWLLIIRCLATWNEVMCVVRLFEIHSHISSTTTN